jgi:hypothetical protein
VGLHLGGDALGGGLSGAGDCPGFWSARTDGDGLATQGRAAALKGEMVEAKIAKSLENLERLACISLMMNEIILNETIVIRWED